MGAQKLATKLGFNKNFVTASANNCHGLLDLGRQAFWSVGIRPGLRAGSSWALRRV
jgi:hypothetical protein